MFRTALRTALYAFGIATVGGVWYVSPSVASIPILFAFPLLWAWYGYTCYRRIRREEFAMLLKCAIHANIPIVPALRAHLSERPRHTYLLLTSCILITLIYPHFFIIGYWIWWRRHDKVLREMCEQLEEGQSLSEAASGAGDWETRVALWLGNATHRPLKTLLLRHEEHSSVMQRMELVFRLLYPASMLCFLFIALRFFKAIFFPRVWRIVLGYESKIPLVTMQFFRWWDNVTVFGSGPALFLGIVAVLSASFLLASPGARWWFPIVSRHFRQEMRGKFLHTLGLALEAGMTLPDALHSLLESQLFSSPVVRRIKVALKSLQSGIPIEEALYQSELLPRHQKAFIQSAVATSTLPETLMMIGNHHISSASIRLRRLSLIVSPLCLLLVAGFVAFFAIAIFSIIISLVEHLL